MIISYHINIIFAMIILKIMPKNKKTLFVLKCLTFHILCAIMKLPNNKENLRKINARGIYEKIFSDIEIQTKFLK